VNRRNTVCRSMATPSPLLVVSQDRQGGRLIAALRNYFKKGLELFPELRFELFDVMFGLSSIILCYKNQKDTKSAEFMELGKNGKVIRVVANYSA
jgi:predicted ester cyclase